MENQNQNVSADNIYKLNGRVPLSKAIPFGLQHVLAMFVSNLAPVLIVCSAAFVHGTNDHLTGAEITQLLQCAMFVAGIGTCLQLYPIWKIGSRLPIVMGVSFTFLGSLLMICTNPDLGYEGMVGAVIAGGIFEGIVGLSARYWKRFLTPVVSACVCYRDWTIITICWNEFLGWRRWSQRFWSMVSSFYWSIYIDRVPCSQIYFKRCI